MYDRFQVEREREDEFLLKTLPSLLFNEDIDESSSSNDNLVDLYPVHHEQDMNNDEDGHSKSEVQPAFAIMEKRGGQGAKWDRKRTQDMSRLAMRILKKRGYAGQDASRMAMRILKKKRGSNAARLAMRVLKKKSNPALNLLFSKHFLPDSAGLSHFWSTTHDSEAPSLEKKNGEVPSPYVVETPIATSE